MKIQPRFFRRTIRTEIQLYLNFNKRQTTLDSYFKKTPVVNIIIYF